MAAFKIFKSKDAKLGYVAGIVDGEGSIIICRSIERRGRVGRLVQLRVVVCNTNEWLIRWLCFQFGGTVVKRKAWKTLQRRQIYDWVIGNQKAGNFLKLILPYLVLKRQQAELAISFQSTRKRGGRVGIKQITAEDSVYDAMKKLNAYGKEVPTDAFSV